MHGYMHTCIAHKTYIHYIKHVHACINNMHIHSIDCITCHSYITYIHLHTCTTPYIRDSMHYIHKSIHYIIHTLPKHITLHYITLHYTHTHDRHTYIHTYNITLHYTYRHRLHTHAYIYTLHTSMYVTLHNVHTHT